MKHPHKKIIKLAFLPFLWILYYLSGLIPRKANIIVYGSPGERFSDNAKYSFIENSVKEKNGIRHYWITKNNNLIRDLKKSGLNVAHRYSLLGIYLCCRAKEFHFSSYISDVNFWLSKGAIKVNYWHGAPFKKIEYDITSGPLKSRYNPETLKEKAKSVAQRLFQPAPHLKPDQLYSPHDFFAPFLMSAFRTSSENLVREPYPRVSFLKQKDEYIESLAAIGAPVFDRTFLRKYSKIILYTPTFRDAEKDWIKNNILKEILPLAESLAKKNILLLIKPHPNEELENTLQNHPNIRIIDSQLDTYLILKEADILLTDYSSISIDAAEAGLNIFLLWPDISTYKEKSREFYFDMNNFFKNKFFATPQEAIESLTTKNNAAKNVKEIVLSKISNHSPTIKEPYKSLTNH